MSLEEVVQAERVLRDANSLEHWGTDWTKGYTVAPSAVVFPETNEEVVELVRLARRDQLKLIPSGGRTGLSGGAVASNGEVVVSFDRMNKILDFNASDRLVRCQAGVVTGALQAFAHEQQLFYPVDFASSGSSQLGGNVATNAGGIKVIRYGMTRRWVAGMRVVTGAGELLDCNRGLVKNATGYDLRHLFIGSEGTLGLICELEMRLAPKPEPARVMVLGVPKLEDILKVHRRFSDQLTLSAFEFFSDLSMRYVIEHRGVAEPLADPAAFYVLLEFDDSETDDASSLFEQCLENGWVVDGVLSQSQAQAQELWVLREGISESISSRTPYKNDVSVTIDQVPEFLNDVDHFVRANYPGFEICWYGHIGDGNLHLNILRPEEMDVESFMALGHEMSPGIFKLVESRKGSISAEHGVGLLKRDFLGFARSPEEIALMNSIKNIFDPDQILNPGKLLV